MFWESIHRNSLAVALQILQKMEVELTSLKILSWRSLTTPYHETGIAFRICNWFFLSARMVIVLLASTHICGLLIKRCLKCVIENTNSKCNFSTMIKSWLSSDACFLFRWQTKLVKKCLVKQENSECLWALCAWRYLCYVFVIEVTLVWTKFPTHSS